MLHDVHVSYFSSLDSLLNNPPFQPQCHDVPTHHCQSSPVEHVVNQCRQVSYEHKAVNLKDTFLTPPLFYAGICRPQGV